MKFKQTEDYYASANRLRALDCFREGHIEEALFQLDLELDDESWVSDYEYMPAYEDDPRVFKTAMLQLADYLERIHKKKLLRKVG
jgi:hypothetical protein